MLRINQNATVKIISCYAPTSASSNEELEEFYTSLSETLQHNTTYAFVCGDFIAKIGAGNQGEKYIGPYGLGTRNDRGDRLAEFVEAERLYVCNYFFKKRLGKRWTWKGPNGIVQNEIDFILTDETIGEKIL